MHPKNVEVRTAGQALLDRYFARFPDTGLQARSNNALRFLTSADEPIRGHPEHWAAAAVYALGDWANPHPYGRDNPLMRNLRSVVKIDAAQLARKAVQVKRRLDLFPSDGANQLMRTMVNVLRDWAPCIREHRPELYAHEPGVAFMLDMLKLDKVATPAKQQCLKRPAKQAQATGQREPSDKPTAKRARRTPKEQ